MQQATPQPWWLNYGPLITFAGALVGGVLAQWISHIFARRRETEKADRLAYERLYAPILMDVFGYFEGVNQGNYMRPPYDSPDYLVDLPDKIIKHVWDNIQYASTGLMQACSTALHEQLRYDYQGERFEEDKLRVIEAFAASCLDVSRRLHSSEDLTSLVHIRLKYRLWLAILAAPHSFIAVRDFMKVSFMLDQFLTPKVIEAFLKDTACLVTPGCDSPTKKIRAAIDKLVSVNPKFLLVAEKESASRAQVQEPDEPEDNNLI